MRIKLIYPDWGHFPLIYRRYIRTMGPAIVAALTPPDIEISFTDERLDPVDIDGNYDLVAISAMTSQANRAYELADIFRKRGIPVVMGGVHTSLMPEEALIHADTIVIGEAEGTWPALIEDFKKGTLKRVYKCPTPPEKMSSPEWGIFRKGIYIPMNSIQVSRGCPVNCEMCSVPQAFGTEFRMTDIDKTIEELERLERCIFVVNDNIHLARRRVGRFLEAMAELGKEWVGLAPLSVAGDLSYLNLLRKSRCWALYVDLSPWVSAGLNEVIDGVQVKKADEYIQRIKDYGIKVIASFVFGFDHDKTDTFERTVEFAKRNFIDEAEFHILTPYPKSRLFERLKYENRLITTDFSKYSTSSVVFIPKNMTPDELYEGYLNAWRWFYSEENCEDIEDGLIVKTFACFPLERKDLETYKEERWVGAVLKGGL